MLVCVNRHSGGECGYQRIVMQGSHRILLRDWEFFT